MADGTHVAEPWDRAEILSLFDPDTGLLDRRVLSDEALYQLELAVRRNWHRSRRAWRMRGSRSTTLTPAFLRIGR